MIEFEINRLAGGYRISSTNGDVLADHIPEVSDTILEELSDWASDDNSWTLANMSVTGIVAEENGEKTAYRISVDADGCSHSLIQVYPWNVPVTAQKLLDNLSDEAESLYSDIQDQMREDSEMIHRLNAEYEASRI